MTTISDNVITLLQISRRKHWYLTDPNQLWMNKKTMLKKMIITSRTVIPVAADSSHILDMLHMHTCWDLEVVDIHMHHSPGYTHNSYCSTGYDLVVAGKKYKKKNQPYRVRGPSLIQKNIDGTNDHFNGKRDLTCLFGLRPHESRMFWLPNKVPLSLSKASSAWALEKNQMKTK